MYLRFIVPLDSRYDQLIILDHNRENNASIIYQNKI